MPVRYSKLGLPSKKITNSLVKNHAVQPVVSSEVVLADASVSTKVSNNNHSSGLLKKGLIVAAGALIVTGLGYGFKRWKRNKKARRQQNLLRREQENAALARNEREKRERLEKEKLEKERLEQIKQANSGTKRTILSQALKKILDEFIVEDNDNAARKKKVKLKNEVKEAGESLVEETIKLHVATVLLVDNRINLSEYDRKLKKIDLKNTCRAVTDKLVHFFKSLANHAGDDAREQFKDKVLVILKTAENVVCINKVDNADTKSRKERISVYESNDNTFNDIKNTYESLVISADVSSENKSRAESVISAIPHVYGDEDSDFGDSLGEVLFDDGEHGDEDSFEIDSEFDIEPGVVVREGLVNDPYRYLLKNGAAFDMLLANITFEESDLDLSEKEIEEKIINELQISQAATNLQTAIDNIREQQGDQEFKISVEQLQSPEVRIERVVKKKILPKLRVIKNVRDKLNDAANFGECLTTAEVRQRGIIIHQATVQALQQGNVPPFLLEKIQVAKNNLQTAITEDIKEKEEEFNKSLEAANDSLVADENSLNLSQEELAQSFDDSIEQSRSALLESRTLQQEFSFDDVSINLDGILSDDELSTLEEDGNSRSSESKIQNESEQKIPLELQQQFEVPADNDTEFSTLDSLGNEYNSNPANFRTPQGTPIRRNVRSPLSRLQLGSFVEGSPMPIPENSPFVISSSLFQRQRRVRVPFGKKLVFGPTSEEIAAEKTKQKALAKIKAKRIAKVESELKDSIEKANVSINNMDFASIASVEQELSSLVTQEQENHALVDRSADIIGVQQQFVLKKQQVITAKANEIVAAANKSYSAVVEEVQFEISNLSNIDYNDVKMDSEVLEFTNNKLKTVLTKQEDLKTAVETRSQQYNKAKALEQDVEVKESDDEQTVATVIQKQRELIIANVQKVQQLQQARVDLKESIESFNKSLVARDTNNNVNTVAAAIQERSDLVEVQLALVAKNAEVLEANISFKVDDNASKELEQSAQNLLANNSLENLQKGLDENRRKEAEAIAAFNGAKEDLKQAKENYRQAVDLAKNSSLDSITFESKADDELGNIFNQSKVSESLEALQQAVERFDAAVNQVQSDVVESADNEEFLSSVNNVDIESEKQNLADQRQQSVALKEEIKEKVEKNIAQKKKAKTTADFNIAKDELNTQAQAVTKEIKDFREKLEGECATAEGQKRVQEKQSAITSKVGKLKTLLAKCEEIKVQAENCGADVSVEAELVASIKVLGNDVVTVQGEIKTVIEKIADQNKQAALAELSKQEGLLKQAQTEFEKALELSQDYSKVAADTNVAEDVKRRLERVNGALEKLQQAQSNYSGACGAAGNLGADVIALDVGVAACAAQARKFEAEVQGAVEKKKGEKVAAMEKARKKDDVRYQYLQASISYLSGNSSTPQRNKVYSLQQRVELQYGKNAAEEVRNNAKNQVFK